MEGVRVPLVALVREAEKKSIAAIKQELDRASGRGVAGPEDYVLSDHRRSPLAMEFFYLLPLTILFDHDLIDGLPAARFSDRLTRRLEAGLSSASV